MSAKPNKNISLKALGGVLSLIAALITIFVFTTGKESMGEMWNDEGDLAEGSRVVTENPYPLSTPSDPGVDVSQVEEANRFINGGEKSLRERVELYNQHVKGNPFQFISEVQNVESKPGKMFNYLVYLKDIPGFLDASSFIEIELFTTNIPPEVGAIYEFECIYDKHKARQEEEEKIVLKAAFQHCAVNLQ